jgi:hypothetical protein
MKRSSLGLILLAVFVASSATPALAASATYLLNMTGAKETAGTVGDPDGLATGTISLDDVSGVVSWNIVYSNLESTLSGFHIHGPATTAQNAAVLIGLGTATTGGPGTLINSLNATPATVAQVLANPSMYYVNIHTTPSFAGGAVRDQLGTIPEPSTFALAAVVAAVLGVTRRRGRTA